MNIKRLALVFVLFVFVVGGCMAKAQNNSYVADVQNFAVSGWTADDEEHTWTLASVSTTADADVYVVTVNADVTGTIGANFKVRLKDGGTTKYFGVLSVSAYSGGVTTLYLFGGTDYVLSGTISEFSYSVARSPFGWPMDEDKWAITYTNATLQYAASLANDTWTNINDASLRVPAGLWNFKYQVSAEVLFTGYASAAILSTTLSDANNTSISELEELLHLVASVSNIRHTFSHSKMIDLSAEQTYYLNTKYFMSGSTISYLANGGDVTPTIIRAVWGGL